jgi:heme-degrading monooxygenase HmoA
MFTRHVTVKLKRSTFSEFLRLLDNQIIPLLKRQNGFQDEIVLVSPERLEVIGMSFWETREDAELYNRSQYAQVLGTLSMLLEGTPKVEIFEVSRWTSRMSVAQGA